MRKVNNISPHASARPLTSIDPSVTVLYVLLLIATVLLPFGVAAGDELVSPAVDGTSSPVSLSCQFYGVEEDTVYVRNNQIIIAVDNFHS